MKKFVPIFFCHFLIVACSDSGSDSGSSTEPTTEPKIVFNDFTEKISYCIGLDHAFGALTIYNSPETKNSFDMGQLELGMVDYLTGNPLQIAFESRDSLLNEYLLENGQVKDDPTLKSDASYAIGLEEGHALVGSLVGRGIDQVVYVDMLVKGVHDGLTTTNPAVPFMEARLEVANYFSKLNLENGQLFLEENSQRDSVMTTESGLQYIVFREGNGLKPNLTDTCVIHYTGRMLDGREFESTVPSKIPAQFTPMGLIPGWQEGLLLMREGARYRLFMPHELAYGPEGNGLIEPFSVLVFDVELIKVKKFK